MKILMKNKKVGFDYFIEKEYEAGIILEGWEVKSLLSRTANLTGSFVKEIKGELYIVGLNVQSLTSTSTHNICDNLRFKKLLMNKKEISTLIGLVSIKGYTLMCNEIYSNGKKIKAKICVCKGKKNYDKRQTIKERDITKNIQRDFKTR